MASTLTGRRVTEAEAKTGLQRAARMVDADDECQRAAGDFKHDSLGLKLYGGEGTTLLFKLIKQVTLRDELVTAAAAA